MESELHEQYEYARRRIRQKKILYYHFVLLIITSFFVFIANRFFKTNIEQETSWHLWAITAWLFVFILHFIKVFITDRFMNKEWERAQIERLMEMQRRKISQLETSIEENTQ